LPAATGPETAKGPTTGLVVFNPTAASWVEVTDAQGTVLLRRMLAAGEVAGASGALPLSAVVGRADVTRVQVRGQPLDLAPIARDNVARFEVK
jgi:cytoskeleton protein RodZ